MNDKTLLALALAKTLYSENRNYLDTFAPFVIRCLNDKQFNPIGRIEEGLKGSYSLNIPLNTIHSILKRLEKDKYVSLKGKGTHDIAAIPESIATDYVQQAKDQADKISRKQNKLIGELRKFLSSEIKEAISGEEVEKHLKNYILENIAKLTLINGEQGYSSFEYDSLNSVNKGITKFLIDVYDREQELYESFNDLLRGAVLWQTIANKEDLNNEDLKERIVVYLDTNIILSLLGLHHESINRAAKQLNQLLQSQNKIYVRVFDKTLEEVINLLAGYKYNKDNYGSQRVNHVYFFLKQAGYDNADIDILIDQIEDKLEEKEVYMEKIGFEEPSDLPERERDLYHKLYTEKKGFEVNKDEDYQKSEEAIHRSSFHDVAAIAKIREIRNGWQTSFERSKAIFLTNSYRLYQFSNRYKLNNEAISEVITDITLTNILWLKNPGSDVGITIDNLLYVHSSDFLVDNGIWTKFLKTLKQMHESGDINEQDYALLTSKNQLTDDYLLSKQKDEINPASVKELNEDIRDIVDKKDEIIEGKDQKIKKVEEKYFQSEEKRKEIQNDKESLEDDFSNLRDDHDRLKRTFKKSEIKKIKKEELVNIAKSLRSKTYKGIGLAVLLFLGIYLLVTFLKFLPIIFPNGISGLDVTTPSFQFIFSTVLSVVLVFGRASYVSIKDSDWSFKDAWWAFCNNKKLENKYQGDLQKLAEEKFEKDI